MPRIFDNIEQKLLSALCQTLAVSERADFCVGYFNLRGWKQIDSYIDKWSGGEGHCCRLLVGMQRPAGEELRAALGLLGRTDEIGQSEVARLKKRLAQEFRDQLTAGAPTNEDEAGLRRLAAQLRAKKVVAKLFLRHPLHAKLYMLFRPDPVNPAVGFVGSSNLTFAGLSDQGELNVDVMDHDACARLARWFEDRWRDSWCVDISKELVDIIDESWAREELIPPYHIYLKMAYHLSQDARAGLAEFKLPRDFGTPLFDFQLAAVKIAARYLNQRGGVLIGDVVGLGKTLMACAVARIFEDDPYFLETLVICPKNLEEMWQGYVKQHRMRARVIPISTVTRDLPELQRYRLVIIDESHNLRNREGKRYRAVRDYIARNDSKVILLTATPYNKSYLDLSSQLRLFVPEDRDLGIRPERKLKEITEAEFVRQHQCSLRSLAAFEHSEYPDDWRELMRLYLVRRTRSFIKDNYAKTDKATGRKYLLFPNGRQAPFPDRVPKTLRFHVAEDDKNDQYARLYSEAIVDAITALHLPRYGLGNYIEAHPDKPPTQAEAKKLKDLSRAGRRLMGFCRTNLFKRLESSGQAFLLSVSRHILRNFVYLHAIEKGLEIPIGTQDSDLLEDEDIENEGLPLEVAPADQPPAAAADFRRRAAKVYAAYSKQAGGRFDWIRPSLFRASLADHLKADCDRLLAVLELCGRWDPARDSKLGVLRDILLKKHPKDKIVIFSQFADTVVYLATELEKMGVDRLAGVTGASDDPTSFAHRFSPVSNNKRTEVPPSDELRVLIATDVLSEGQNLQDCHIVVNYDLPWAIIRLIQRAGRVDRIGQEAWEILCYSFLPADGVERILRLRARVRQRLQENAEVVGSDEAFFGDARETELVRDLYHEKSGILDDEDGEVDLASYAWQVWHNAVQADPRLEKIIPALPPVVFSARGHAPVGGQPAGVLLYVRTAEGNDALAWIDQKGNSVTESQYAVLKAAECGPDTPALRRAENHHELVRKGMEQIMADERGLTGGQLGRPSGARYKTYMRLKHYQQSVQGQLFDTVELDRTIDDIYRYPLREAAKDALNRLLRTGAGDGELAKLAMHLREDGRLCVTAEESEKREPSIVCSLGLLAKED